MQEVNYEKHTISEETTKERFGSENIVDHVATK
jgi:hypothetical protein